MEKLNVSSVCQELQNLQRQRAVVIKSRNMQMNRLRAIIAGTIGYSNSLKESERAKKFKEAEELIHQVVKGEETHQYEDIIKVTMMGVGVFNDLKKKLEGLMRATIKQLPIMPWIIRSEQNGISIDYLAVIIGETGDLSNYDNPAKVWRRMGCAPYDWNGGNWMGSTWRMQSRKVGKLPAEEWEKFGYSPRRRSIAYLIGEGIVRQNGTGPYRRRYDETKVKIKKDHPDYSDLRCHRHGMLLATKLFLKNLWIEWHLKSE